MTVEHHITRAKRRSFDPPALYPFGDLSRDSLVSIEVEAPDPVVIDFVASQAGCSPSHETILCWVADDGALHHHYRLVGCHREHSWTGHAFVAFAHHHGTELPAHASEVRGRACSFFRVTTCPGAGHVHRVELCWFCGGVWATASSSWLDDELRVILRPPRSEEHRLPPSSQSWELTFEFICPPHPAEAGSPFDASTHTVYIWGDLSFNVYGPEGRCPLHGRRMNQIVPQLMTGRVLSSSEAGGAAHWSEEEAWALQAQYYWEGEAGESRALCGNVVDNIKRGDVIRSSVAYDPSSGVLTASIQCSGRASSIRSERPFPDGDPPQFASWRHFFQAGEAGEAGRGAFGRPTMCVEYKGDCDLRTLCGLLPFDVRSVGLPGATPRDARDWTVELYSPRAGECLMLRQTSHRLGRVLGGLLHCLQHRVTALHATEAAVGCGPPRSL